MIIDRYIIREISRPMLAICLVLIAIFASYSAAEYLADAVSGLFPPDAVLLMLLLRIVIALEVLLPTTLYLAVVIALGRMYRDSEMVALSSCGIGISRVLRSVFYFGMIIALLVAILSFYIRPWAYKKVYELKALAKSDFDISRMEAGNFYEIKSVHLVIFAQKVDHRINRAEQVFIRGVDNTTLEIIFASQVYQRMDKASGRRALLLRDGDIYEFARGVKKGKITHFRRATYFLSPKNAIPIKYRRKAASMDHLMHSDKLKDVAELQWRLSTPLSAILLALLAVPLSYTRPRQGKYGKLVAAVLVFAVYYNISVVVRNWVEKGVLAPLPGVGWVQAAMVALIVFLLWKSGQVFVRGGKKAWTASQTAHR